MDRHTILMDSGSSSGSTVIELGMLMICNRCNDDHLPNAACQIVGKLSAAAGWHVAAEHSWSAGRCAPGRI